MGFLERWLERRRIKRKQRMAEDLRFVFDSASKSFSAIKSPEDAELNATFAVGPALGWIGMGQGVTSKPLQDGDVDVIEAAWWETDPSKALERLNPGSRQLLDFLSEGASDEEIAERLGVDVPTARENIRILLGSLNVRSRLAATALVYPRGFFLSPRQ